MEQSEKTITVSTIVEAPLASVWEIWTAPVHIMAWNNASPDWHTPYAENDLREGGSFKSTMAAKDGSMSFDFGGTYTKVVPLEVIEYTMGDGRKVAITFTEKGASTEVIETFEPENTHPADFQKAGWQAIIDNFKRYTEEIK